MNVEATNDYTSVQRAALKRILFPAAFTEPDPRVAAEEAKWDERRGAVGED